MWKKYLALLGLGVAVSLPVADTASAAEWHRPYADPGRNQVYNLLFADDVALLRQLDASGNGVPGAAVRQVLLAQHPDLNALRTLADNAALEARVRALAFHRLRAAGQPVPAKRLLGVIVEVPQPRGLDVLAAYSDGGVRYLNQSEALFLLEGPSHPAIDQVRALLKVSEPLLAHLGPSLQPRQPPPAQGRIRITFLVSDGLYIGEGPADAMMQDALGGAVMHKAAQLLQRTVDVSLGTSGVPPARR